MSAEQGEEQPKVSFQTITDFVMGVLYVGIAILILFARKFGNFEITGPLAWAFSGLLMLYGAFRLYRGMVAVRRNG